MNIGSTVKLKVKQEKFFYGWVIVFMGALGMFFSGPGQTFSVSIFINSYVNDFGWSRSLVSSLYSIATLIAGLLLPVIGRRVDIAGHRKMFVVVPLILSSACLWMSFVINPLMLVIGFIFIRLLGQGSMTLLAQTLIPKWFVMRRGTALSLMSLGLVVSSAFLPLLNNALIINNGIVFAWRTLAIMLLIIMVPLAWIFIKNKPEDIGLQPDGKSIEIKKETKNIEDETYEEQPWTLKEAKKTRAFWFMLFCMLIPSMINTGLTFHFVSILEEGGFSSTFAATILGTIALVQFPCTFVAGYICDKFKIHIIKSINYFLLLIAMLLIIFGSSEISFIVYGVLMGVFLAFDSVSTGVLWPNYFGVKHLGSIRGVTMTVIVLASSLGPLPFGFAFDMFQSYSQIIGIMLIFPLLGSIASFVSPKPMYEN